MSLILSTAPHIRARQTTRRLMGNVLLSLLPCAAAGVYFFGLRALLVLLVSTLSAIAAEYLWHVLSHKKADVTDLSAAVTGLLLGLCVTPAVPLWAVAAGSVFAIIIVKQLFGGIGDNFLNPALTARAVLLASWPALMTTHLAPAVFPATDAVASATPLATGGYTAMQLLLGQTPGAIGETCKIAVLVGFVFLLLTGTVSWRIPTVTILSAFVIAWALKMDPLSAVLSGGLLFGAVFMATDYTTSPMHPLPQTLYAVGIGVMTILIRAFGAYPEGVTYAILLMNILTPLLDRMMPRRIYGHGAVQKEGKRHG